MWVGVSDRLACFFVFGSGSGSSRTFPPAPASSSLNTSVYFPDGLMDAALAPVSSRGRVAPCTHLHVMCVWDGGVGVWIYGAVDQTKKRIGR